MNYETATTTDDPRAAYGLLLVGVPLSLVLDLTTPLDSRQVYAAEGGNADWLPVAVAS